MKGVGGPCGIKTISDMPVLTEMNIYIYCVNAPFRTILIAICAIALCMLMVKCQSSGLNFSELEHSDEQKQFEKKLLAQQNVLDSLTKVYKNRPVIVNSFYDIRGNVKKIILYKNRGYNVLDTLKPGETVQFIDMLPQYEFRPGSVVRKLGNVNTTVKTKKGVTGMISYFYIEDFKNILKEKKLETDTL